MKTKKESLTKSLQLFQLGMLLKTGVPKLDSLLKGGIKKNNSILISSVPGVRSLEFAQQILYSRLQQGDHGLYFVNNKKPSTVKFFMINNYDWDLAKYEKKGNFSFLDCYSNTLGMPAESKFSVKNTTDIKEICKKLISTLKKIQNKNTLLVFDSFSSLLDLCGVKKVSDCLDACLASLKDLNITPVFLFTEWPYGKTVIKKIRSMFDCVIDLKAVEKKVILRNYYTVSKASWVKKLEKKEIPFKVISPGGVRVYVPKILVTGPYSAGKTSFVHSASIKAVSVDRLGTTVALDHGHVEYKGTLADLFGTPGQERFDPILEHLGGESLGVVVIVDSTNPKGFVRAKDMLEKTKTSGLPSVIAANKANLKGALKPDEIRKKMKLPKEIPIVPVIADDLKKVKPNKPCKLRDADIHKVLEALFEEVV